MWGAAPSEPIRTIFGTLSHPMDFINFAKFYFDGQGVSVWGRPKHAFIPLKAKSSLTLLSAATLTVILASSLQVKVRLFSLETRRDVAAVRHLDLWLAGSLL